MPKLNFAVFLNTYSDNFSTNNPSLSNFKWNRNINGICVNNPMSNAFQLAPGETKTLFNGSRTLAQDNTTEWSLAPKALTTSTYVLSWSGGTNPVIRTARTTGADATTQVTVTQNGPLLTFTSTAGTPFALSGVAVGDFVRLGNLFNILNQSVSQIVSFTSTSFTVSNETGVAEGPITLGSGFASQVSIYSAAGVQIGDTLLISGGFSPVSQNAYEVTDVGAGYVEFSCTAPLPTEGPITTESIVFYTTAKQLVYLESDQHCQMSINGSTTDDVRPFIVNNNTLPGIFMRSATVYSMSVTNLSTTTANLFLAAVE